MFAYRTTWIVKEGRMQEALELMSAAIDKGKPADAMARIYTPSISPNVLVFEEVWEDDASHEAFWKVYRGSPEGDSFFSQLYELAERSTGTERWNVVEWR